MAVDSYLNDYILYLHVIHDDKKIKLERTSVMGFDPRQRTLRGMIGPTANATSNLTAMERIVRSLRNDLRSKKLALQVARGKANESVCLKGLLRQEKLRNTRDQILSRVGHKKLEQLIKVGILTARQLINYAGVPQEWSQSRDTAKQFKGFRRRAVESCLRSEQK
jgi:hypothetical protein